MYLHLKTIKNLAVAGTASLLLLPAVAMSDGGARYKVTISNLTAGQPLTPPVLVTHSNKTSVFGLGEYASEGVRSIAENGDSVPLVTALAGDIYVRHVVEGTAPIVPAHNPGGTPFDSTATLTISAGGHARYLSFVSMLICTNDGFTGLDSIRLPARKKTVYVVGYETRTEQNTEDFADIVPPCQGLIGVTSDDAGTGMSDPLLLEKGIIIPHAGVHGGSDLQPSVHDWSDPVAKIVIERIRQH